jgi:hypothetical protein
MVYDHLITRALGEGTRNLEKLEIWRKKIHSLGWPRRSDEDVDHIRQVSFRV